MEPDSRIAFGPVPSRRLGRSLGINHIPAKSCSYACAYCQVGATLYWEIEPRAYFPSTVVEADVRARLEILRARGERVDYLTFVPDGEPTLDVGLGRTIDALRPLGIPIAVITNGSLLWRADVRARVGRADLVSVKVDAAGDVEWQSINHPHPTLDARVVHAGLRTFAQGYAGELITETMLLAGLNDGEDSLRETASLVASLEPAVAYLSIPTRPPLDPRARAPGEEAIVRAYDVFRRQLPVVELLTGFEGDTCSTTGDVAADLLGISAVHPVRESQARSLLRRAGSDWDVVKRLLESGELQNVNHAGHRFLVRRLPRASSDEVR